MERVTVCARHVASPAKPTPPLPLVGKPRATVWRAVRGGKRGLVRLRYDEDGHLENVARVPTRGGRASGLQLYFHGEPPAVTYKTESGLSGECWSHGAVNVGTVYDDDGPAFPGTRISLTAWLRRCLNEMTGGGEI
jgi:hypothetical protein